MLDAPGVQAADQRIALAYPIDGARIEIDGDLSDWPAHLPRYAVGIHFAGGEPVDAEDLSAEFRVGYDAATNALYVAIEVQDADRGTVVFAVEPYEYEYDAAYVWVQVPSKDKPQARPLGFMAGLGKAEPSTANIFGPWYLNRDPPVHFVSATVREASQWRCEYRIDIDSLTQGKHRLAPGQAIEFNLWLYSVDTVPGGFENEEVSWVAPAPPHQPDGRGYVLLVPSNVALGWLGGQVRLWDGQPPGTAKKVRIESESNPETVVRTLTDAEGNFEVELPVGRYRVAVDQRGWETRDHPVVAVASETVARVDLTAPQVTGRALSLGEGRVHPVGRGTRRGAWLTYGVAEGLPTAHVSAIVQDKRGDLWLGTGGGLSHFDGQRWRSWRSGNGLPMDELRTLMVDRAGRVELHEDEFDINALVADLAAMFKFRCQQKGLAWRVETLDGNVRWVRGDQGKLRQILINLLNNAVKFTVTGEVVLRVESGE